MNRASSWVVAGFSGRENAVLAGVILRLEGNMRSIPEEPDVRLECGCRESMLGAIHELGELEKGQRVWYQFCFSHGLQKVKGTIADERTKFRKPRKLRTPSVPPF